MEPGVMTRLFYASPQAIKNPALRWGLMLNLLLKMLLLLQVHTRNKFDD